MRTILVSVEVSSCKVLLYCLQGEVSTHVHQQAGLGEDRGGWLVTGDVTVELLTIAVPLDTVQSVPLHVIPALQHHVLPEDGVGREGGSCEADTGDRCQAWDYTQNYNERRVDNIVHLVISKVTGRGWLQS